MEERLDERHMGLVGVPLSMFENASDSNSDGDMVDPNLFMQQLDAKTSKDYLEKNYARLSFDMLMFLCYSDSIKF